MKSILAILVGLTLSASFANAQGLSMPEEAATELDAMQGRGWHHVGCVSQINSDSRCQQMAQREGHSCSRIQQDYLCNPKIMYSCYGSCSNGMDSEISDSSDAVSDSTSFQDCSRYQKASLCASHIECKWVGSCIFR